MATCPQSPFRSIERPLVEYAPLGVRPNVVSENFSIPEGDLEFFFNLWGGHWKRAICIKLSENDFQIRDKFATVLRTLPLMYDTTIPAILRKFGAHFATNLCSAPLANAPFSGFLWAL